MIKSKRRMRRNLSLLFSLMKILRNSILKRMIGKLSKLNMGSWFIVGIFNFWWKVPIYLVLAGILMKMKTLLRLIAWLFIWKLKKLKGLILCLKRGIDSLSCIFWERITVILLEAKELTGQTTEKASKNALSSISKIKNSNYLDH